MADVKWIKIVTDIFDDEKIQVIESMPEGDTIVVIWFKLLCLAGKVNQSGLLLLTSKIAYTEDMLSAVFRHDVKLVRIALTAFEQMGMIEITDNTLHVVNWDKHQNIKGLDEIREQARLRQQAYRDRQKSLPESTENKNVEEDKEYKNKSKSKNALHNATRNVTKRKRFTPPTIDEVSSYCKERNNSVDPERFIDFYSSKGWKVGNQPMKDWKAAVRTWEKREQQPVQKRKGKTVIEQQYNQRDYTPEQAKQYTELTPEEIAEAQKYET